MCASRRNPTRNRPPCDRSLAHDQLLFYAENLGREQQNLFLKNRLASGCIMAQTMHIYVLELKFINSQVRDEFWIISSLWPRQVECEIINPMRATKELRLSL